jgi:hypothetical protein
LLSQFEGCPTARTVPAAVAPSQRPTLAKVVAGVVERGRVSVARSAYSWRTVRSGSVWVGHRSEFAPIAVLDRRVISTGCRGAVGGAARKGGGVGGLACFPG